MSELPARISATWVGKFSEEALRRLLSSSDANVFEPHGAQADGIQKVLRIHDKRFFQQLLDTLKIEHTELRPSRAYDESIHTFGRGISRIAIPHRTIQPHLSFGERNRIVCPYPRAFGDQRLRQPHRRRPPH